MAEMKVHIWPNRLVFGPGASARAGEELAALGGRKALLVSDPGVVRAGIVGQVTAALKDKGLGYVLFDKVEPNPRDASVQAAAALFIEEGCDALLAVGGGSAMDTAKMAGVLTRQGGKVQDYQAPGAIARPVPPLLAIPTTCGTGSEVTPFAVITDPARHFKMSFASPYLVPQVAILDPDLCLTLPAKVIASTALDALTHAIEGYLSLEATPFTEGLSLQAISLISRHLRPAVRAASLEDISQLLYASTIAGMAFANAILGLVHALAHPLGGHYDLAHGVANAILLPYVMEFNREACPQRMADVGRAMGVDTRGLNETEAAEEAIRAVRALSRDVGIPQTLAEADIGEEHIPQMAADALRSRNVATNPRRASVEDLIRLYHRALRGHH